MNNVKLKFSPPTIEKDIMFVEELSQNEEAQQLAPFKASRWEVFPGQSSPLDVHSVKECWFVAQGEGELTCDGQALGLIKQGDILYFESNRSHSVKNIGSENMLIFSTWWKA